MKRITKEQVRLYPPGTVVHTASGLYATVEPIKPKAAPKKAEPVVKEVRDEREEAA